MEEPDCSGVGTWKLRERLREKGPLVQCITNFVSMDIMANVLLAVGASPAMVRDQRKPSEFPCLQVTY
jgi:hydroxyethylthiazole kinase